jgi:hypothetical protein
LTTGDDKRAIRPSEPCEGVVAPPKLPKLVNASPLCATTPQYEKVREVRLVTVVDSERVRRRECIDTGKVEGLEFGEGRTLGEEKLEVVGRNITEW